jgi:hypothetical protein
MPTSVETEESPSLRINTVARAMAKTQNPTGAGMAQAFCVRLSSSVLGLLESAKPEEQSMVEFLRECGITVALQRLAESQK